MVENRRKIIKRISSIIIACASALMLCISPFLPKIQPKTMIASADTVSTDYIFNGSNIFINFSKFTSTPPSVSNSTNFIASVYISNLSTSQCTVNVCQVNSSGYASYTFSDVTNVSSNDWYMIYRNLQGYASNELSAFAFLKGSAFNADVLGVTISQSSGTGFSNGLIPGNYGITTLHYFGEGEDNWFNIAFINFANIYNTDTMLSTRTYFFDLADKDSAQYQLGYSAGLTDGELLGYEDGYSRGNRIGYNQGYGAGYNTGINEANTYSFSNLIGAVIDVPVQAFMSLFNFELLGINLADFFLSLLTLCFIVTIVRLLI